MSKASLSLMVIFLALCSAALAQLTITNGSFEGNIDGWESFQGNGSYQAINSPNDEVAASGSALFVATAAHCSFSQPTALTCDGQTLTVYADVAWDGDWEYIFFGFYEDNIWDRIDGASVDIVPLVAADTDGTLDSFQTVEATGTLPNSGNPLRIFIGTSCTPYTAGAYTPGTSSVAIDRVSTQPVETPTPTPTPPPSSAGLWCLYY